MPSLTGVAVKLFREVYGVCGGNKDLEKGLRSRARTVPSLIASNGLASTLAFLMSKSDKDMFKALVSEGPVSKEIGKASKEEASYTLYLYVLYRFLSEESGFMGECSDFQCLAGEIQKLDSERGRAMAASELALEFAVEFKKIAEAILEKGEQG